MKIKKSRKLKWVRLGVFLLSAFPISAFIGHAAELEILPSRYNYRGGDHSFGPAFVPTGATVARFEFDTKDKLQKGERITVIVRTSQDGGLTWEPNGGLPDFRGPGKIPDFEVPLLGNSANQERRIEGRLTLTGGPMRLGAKIVFE